MASNLGTVFLRCDISEQMEKMSSVIHEVEEQYEALEGEAL